MSTQYRKSSEVPTEILAKRLSELADAVTKGPDSVRCEFTMRVPAELDHDADLVLSGASMRLTDLAEKLDLVDTAPDKSKFNLKMGVGFGDGSLFVYGDHDSIMAAQSIVDDRARLSEENEKLKQQLREVPDECPVSLTVHAERGYEVYRNLEPVDTDFGEGGALRGAYLAGFAWCAEMQALPACVVAVVNAWKDHENAVKDYNDARDQLVILQEGNDWSGNVNAQYQLMNDSSQIFYRSAVQMAQLLNKPEDRVILECTNPTVIQQTFELAKSCGMQHTPETHGKTLFHNVTADQLIEFALMHHAAMGVSSEQAEQK